MTRRLAIAGLFALALGGCVSADMLSIFLPARKVLVAPGPAPTADPDLDLEYGPPVRGIFPTPAPRAVPQQALPAIRIRVPDEQGGGGGGISPGVPKTPSGGPVLSPEALLSSLTVDLPSSRTEIVRPAGWQVRAIYTEAVLRDRLALGDMHMGLAASETATGYDLLVPAGDAPQTTVSRPKFERFTVLNDPRFPGLTDPSITLDPKADSETYILGASLLWTSQANGFPPMVADPFDRGVSSKNVGSVDRVPWTKPLVEAGREAFAALWATPLSCVGPDGQTLTATPSVHDLPLEGGLSTRFYLWEIQYGVARLDLGSRLPLGRVVVDVRAVDSQGNAIAFGTRQVLLQQGANPIVMRSAAVI